MFLNNKFIPRKLSSYVLLQEGRPVKILKTIEE